MNVLLIQIREDKKMRDHELEAFIAKSGLPREAFHSLNVFSESLDAARLEGVDALVIGGSGEYCVSENHLSCQQALFDFVKEARRRRVPTLGVCFGSHILAAAFGGQIVFDKSRQETGTFEVTLTDAALGDPLFSASPKTFLAQFGHNDQIEHIPDRAILLATSERAGNQAWTFPHEPVYAVQFHMELDEQWVIDRLNYYAALYLDSRDEFDEIRAALKPSPDASKLLHRFFDVVVGGA